MLAKANNILISKDFPQEPGGERVFLGFGSNIGRRPDNLRRALRLLVSTADISLLHTSFLYNTTPVGYTAQRDFLNGVAEIRTYLHPMKLHQRLQEIERRMGKSVPFRDGPRKIDVDLLLYGKRVVGTRNLTVPHPRLHQRKFVLVPMGEIAPAVVHPGLKKTMARLLSECRSDEKVHRWGAWRR